jgi:hypothetical protein
MGLADWTLKEVGERMVRLAQELRDPVLASELLAEARQDTPIIADVLHHIAVLAVAGGPRGKNRDLQFFRRDLLLFLAIRELAQEEKMAHRAGEVSSN